MPRANQSQAAALDRKREIGRKGNEGSGGLGGRRRGVGGTRVSCARWRWWVGVRSMCEWSLFLRLPVCFFSSRYGPSPSSSLSRSFVRELVRGWFGLVSCSSSCSPFPSRRFCGPRLLILFWFLPPSTLMPSIAPPLPASLRPAWSLGLPRRSGRILSFVSWGSALSITGREVRDPGR